MLSLVFPKRTHPEDSDPIISFLAKTIFWVGLIFLVWGGYQMAQWSRSFGFSETEGEINYGDWHYVRSGVGAASFDYEVNGQHYVSQNIAFGGRILGKLPPEGKVKVYYDPVHPAFAVLLRRPTEMVIFGFLFGLVSPFLARWIWVEYV